MERRLLQRALERDGDERRGALLSYIALRRQREAALPSSFARAERGIETIEGRTPS